VAKRVVSFRGWEQCVQSRLSLHYSSLTWTGWEELPEGYWRESGNSFPAQRNGRGKVVISVEHRMGSRLSLFDFFRFPKGPNDSAFSELVLCSSPNVGTQLGGFLFFGCYE